MESTLKVIVLGRGVHKVSEKVICIRKGCLY